MTNTVSSSGSFDERVFKKWLDKNFDASGNPKPILVYEPERPEPTEVDVVCANCGIHDNPPAWAVKPGRKFYCKNCRAKWNKP